MNTAKYEYEGTENRPHLSGVSYILPNDDQKINRLDLQHYLLRYMLKGNYLAPIVQPAHILDSGCGTGRWLVEMAEEFPQAELIGVDRTLPEPGKVAFPPNCHFQVGNTLNGLPFEDGAFDFVHQRLLLFTIPQAYWQQVVNELARVIRRGGWVELIEVNPFFQQMGPATTRIVDLITQAATQHGLDMGVSQRLGSLLSNAGLKRVGTSTQIVPLGHWGGQLGTLALEDIEAIAQALKPLILAQSGISSGEFEHLATRMFNEVEEFHTIFTFHVAYGSTRGTGLLV
ncbi:MAG TPA: methyltransferase domain-containing protein [Ktedonobacteraceae bacterium]|nr:methyltransferase domain-containing protein [Ktedonobacteraceae bacterium]